MTVRHALVIADGRVADPEVLDAAWPGWSEAIDLVVAADGGARHAERLGRTIDRWVGDADSLGEEALEALAAAGVAIDRRSMAKDETDAELAVLAAVGEGAERITILGALGGRRFDHALGNVWLLALPAVAGSDLRLVDAEARIRLVGSGRADLAGRIGDVVSLLPFAGDALGVSTFGLRYPLDDEPLIAGPARGLSNVRDAADASLEVRSGRILVIETPATL
jgi:thiamine pyrophosphokinase